MIFWGDRFVMPRPDTYKVVAVSKSGYYRGTWHDQASYPTRADAMGYARKLIESGDYTHVGIEPHASECGIFQSHALETIWQSQQNRF